jgi:formylglycine-generating enzyme required for sulfatase activity
LAWNYNALASVETDAILLTHGDNDTYPAWVMQAAKGVRPDVEVINVNLLFYDEYRNRVFEKLDIAPLDSANFMEYQELYLAITQRLMRQAERPVYLGMGIPEFLRKALGDSLYLTGLAFKYSPQPFDNVAVLKNNFEKRFLLDHLKIQLEADTGSYVAARMNLNYIPALIMLHRHYEASGETAKSNEVQVMTMQVAREGGREEDLRQYFYPTPNSPVPFETSISARDLDKGMVKIKDNLYASSTEVTNEQYEAFLLDLLKNKEFELLAKCKAPQVDWRSLLPDEYINLPDSKVFLNAHPDDAKAPVLNISYEAAQEYCRWITKVYNQSAEKRKKFGQVTFRLPSEKEWEEAAAGGRNITAGHFYPWGGNYYRNAKGCFLANFEVLEEEPCQDCPGQLESNDGGFFPVHAEAYFPNDFGLYNTSGNVAEMTMTPGIAKGGSWADKPEDCRVNSRKKYDGPSPAVGFRVFMDVK